MRQCSPTRNWTEHFVFEKWLSELARLVTAERWPKVMVPKPIMLKTFLLRYRPNLRPGLASHPVLEGARSPGQRLGLQNHDKSTSESSRSTVLLFTALVPLILTIKQKGCPTTNEETYFLSSKNTGFTE